MEMRHNICAFQILFLGLHGLQVGIVMSVQSAQICLEIGLKNKFSYWFALVSGADPDKEYGGAIIIWANKVLISEQNHFWFAGGLWENCRSGKLGSRGYWRNFGGGEGGVHHPCTPRKSATTKA